MKLSKYWKLALILSLIIFLVGCPKPGKPPTEKDKTTHEILFKVLTYNSTDNTIIVNRGENDYINKVDKQVKVIKNIGTKDNPINIDWVRIIATGTIFEIYPSTSVIKLDKLYEPPEYADIVSGQIDLNPPDPDNPFFSLWLRNIQMKDIYDKNEFYTIKALMSTDKNISYDNILQKMLSDIHETAVEFDEYLSSNSVTGGKFAGMTYKEAILATTIEDIVDFILFLKYYPGKYLTKSWKFNEIYMTWIINDTPDAKNAILREKAVPVYLIAADHMKKNELEIGEETIKEALQIYPDFKKAKQFLNNLKELKELRKTLKNDPDNLEDRFKLGELYYYFQNYTDSKIEFQKVLETDYKKGTTLFRIGKTHFASDEYTKAIDYFKQAKAADPTLDFLDKWIKISTALEKIQSDPSNKSENYMKIGKVFFDDEVFEDASNYYMKAVEVDSNNLEALAMVGKIKQIQDGYQNFEWFKSNFTEEFKYFYGLELLNKSIGIFKENDYKKGLKKIYKDTGELFEEIGNPYLARRYYEYLIELDPESPDGIVDMVSTYTLYQDYELAIKTADDGLKKFPNNPSLLNLKGFSLRKLHKFEEAIPYFIKAKELDKDFFTPLESLVISYLNLNKFEKAEEVFVEMEKAFPDKSSFKLMKLQYEKLIALNKKDKLTREESILKFVLLKRLFIYDKAIKHGLSLNLDKSNKDIMFKFHQTLGEAYYFNLDYDNAIKHFKKALTFYPSVNVKEFLYYCHAIKNLKSDPGYALINFTKSEIEAGEYFDAYTFLLLMGDSPEKKKLEKLILKGIEAQKFITKGNRFSRLYNYEEAFENYKRAEKIFKDIDDYNSVISLNLKMFWSAYTLGRSDDVKQIMGKIDYLFSKHAFKNQERFIRNARTDFYLNYGQYESAINEQLALLIMDDLFFEIYNINYTYNSLARSYYSAGNNAKAIENYLIALEYSEAHSNYYLLTNISKDIAWIYAREGKLNKSREYSDLAYSYFIKGEYYPFLELSILNLKAEVSGNFGELEKAVEDYNKLYTVATRIGDDFWRGAAKNNLGELQVNFLGDFENSEKNLKEAVKLFRLANKPKAISIALSNLAELYYRKGDYEEALKTGDESLKIAEEYNNFDSMVSIYLTKGKIYYEKKDYETATDNVNKSIKYSNQIGYIKLLWKAHLLRGKINEDRGKSELAVQDYKLSIKLLNDIFITITSEEHQEKFFKFENKSEPYTRLIEILIKLDRKEEALRYLEEQKSFMTKEAFKNFDQIGTDNPELKTFLKDIKEKEQKNENLKKLLKQEKEKPKDEQDKAKIKYLNDTIAKTEGEFNQLMLKLEFKYPDVYSLLSIKPVNLGDIRKKLPANAIILEYFITDESLYIFLIAKDGFKAQNVQIKSDALEDKVINFKRLITNTDSTKELYQNLNDLYNILIKPVETEIEGYEVLSIVPFGILYYLPYAALIKEFKNSEPVYLIDSKKIDYLTSATILDLVEEKSKIKKDYSLIAFGNPENNLPYSELEVIEIKKTIFNNAKIYIKEDATKSKFFEEAKDYNIVHLATHGILKYKPLDSFIILAGEDKKLTILDIAGYDKMRKNVDIVVLSACETAIEKKRSKGKEFISIAKAFATAGVPTLIATLWKINDASTKELFLEFYANLKTKKQGKLEALHNAQLKQKSNKKYSHPYYWASYLLIGDFK